MGLRKGWRGRLIACLVLFLGHDAGAGSLAIDPVRLDLSTAAPVAALNLHNEGAEPMLLQLELVRWSMDGAQELYVPTNELLATPPIFTIEPGQSQIVRVGMRQPIRERQERSFRLFVQEPPQSVAPTPEQAQKLHVALRIGIPVFVAPGVPPQENINWRLWRSEDGAVGIEASNTGNIHARLLDVRLATMNGKREWSVETASTYLLAGHTRQWILPSDAAVPDEPLSLKARAENGAVEVSLEPERL
jgi:fimbrial chaperone protein